MTLKFILQATGDVTTSDIDLAVASKAIVFGFNVRAPGSLKSYADNKCVEIRIYKVIYELIDDVRNAMEGLLDPVEVIYNTLKSKPGFCYYLYSCSNLVEKLNLMISIDLCCVLGKETTCK